MSVVFRTKAGLCCTTYDIQTINSNLLAIDPPAMYAICAQYTMSFTIIVKPKTRFYTPVKDL